MMTNVVEMEDIENDLEDLQSLGTSPTPQALKAIQAEMELREHLIRELNKIDSKKCQSHPLASQLSSLHEEQRQLTDAKLAIETRLASLISATSVLCKEAKLFLEKKGVADRRNMLHNVLREALRNVCFGDDGKSGFVLANNDAVVFDVHDANSVWDAIELALKSEQ